MKNQNYGIHITYERDLKLKELSELLKVVHLSFNDCFREKGIKSRSFNNLAPVVSKVKEGSIVLEILMPVLEELRPILEEITPKLIAKFIEWRLNRIIEKKKNRNYTNCIQVEAGANSTININITNGN